MDFDTLPVQIVEPQLVAAGTNVMYAPSNAHDILVPLAGRNDVLLSRLVLFVSLLAAVGSNVCRERGGDVKFVGVRIRFECLAEFLDMARANLVVLLVGVDDVEVGSGERDVCMGVWVRWGHRDSSDGDIRLTLGSRLSSLSPAALDELEAAPAAGGAFAAFSAF